MGGNDVRSAVEAILSRSASEEMMLDAFWQWASNPTSKSAGLALDENLSRIEDNLRRRYADPLGARDVVRRLAVECRWLSSGRDVYEAQGAVRTTIGGELGQGLRRAIANRLATSSLTAKCLVALLVWLRDEGVDEHRLRLLFDDPALALQALLRATLGGLPGPAVLPFDAARDELVASGILNRLYWLNSKRTSGRETYEYGVHLPEIALEDVVPPRPPADAQRYISELLISRTVELARLVEEVAWSSAEGVPGLRIYDRFVGLPPTELLAAVPGFLLGVATGYSEGGDRTFCAVNPLLRTVILQSLVSAKAVRLEPLRVRVVQAVNRLRDKLWPRGDLVTLKDQPDRKVWRLDCLGEPSAFIYLGNWFAAHDLMFLGQQVPSIHGTPLVLVLADQSLPSAKKALGPWWGAADISIAVLAGDGFEVEEPAGPAGHLPRLLLDALVPGAAPQQAAGPVPAPPEGAKPLHEPGDHPTGCELDSATHELLLARTPIVVGWTSPQVNWGIVGSVGDQYVALSLTVGRLPGTQQDVAQTISLFGVQGSGKSYSMGVILETALRPVPPIAKAGSPLAGIVFHYSKSERYPPEYLGMCYPNKVLEDVSQLRNSFGVEPQGIADLVVLVPESRADDTRREFPDHDVQPLLFDPQDLAVDDWQLLMGVPGTSVLYMEQVKSLLQDLRRDGRLSLGDIRAAVEGSDMDLRQKKLALTRLGLASRYLLEGASVGRHIRAGALTVVDIRDRMLGAADAMRLCLICLRQFQNAKTDGRNIPKLIVLDEAHKYIHSDFADEIETVVREMRHTATSVAIASQDPLGIPPKVIGLSSVVVIHRTTSGEWLKHIRRGCSALGGLTDEEAAALQPGEAFLWAKDSTDRRFSERGRLIRIRPRFTQHGL